jgi:hypothetical protein
MNAKDFILELQKYYGAFLYFSADRRLKFVNRGRFACSTPKDITNDIYEDEDIEEQRCMPNSYSSILCNVRGNWKINSQGVLELWEGWVFIWWNEEVSTYEWLTGVNGDLSNIPNGMKYLDLRQKLTFSGNDFTYSFSNVLFDSRNSVDRFNDYKTVLQKQTRKFYAVDRTDIELQDQIQVFENSKLQVYRIKESLLNETMQLELIEIPDDK